MAPSLQQSNAKGESMPYLYGEGCLDMGISEFSFDGGASGSPDYEDRVVTLYEYGEWEEATIQGSIEASGLDRLFPDEEGPPFPAKLVVVVDCPETQTRFETVVREAPTDEDTYTFSLGLDRPLVRGTVTLLPRLVRTEPCREGLPYAPNAGMRVAGGEQWELVVDEPEKDADGFPFKYRDFSPEGMPSEELAHAFSPNPNPKMMINNQHEGVVDVLQSGGTYGFRPLMKRVLKSDFGSMLWMQLVLHTASTIAETESTEFDWQEGVVVEITETDLCESLFDESLDYDDVVERLGEKVDDTSELRDFVRTLSEAVQLYTDHPTHLNRFIEEEAP